MKTNKAVLFTIYVDDHPLTLGHYVTLELFIIPNYSVVLQIPVFRPKGLSFV